MKVAKQGVEVVLIDGTLIRTQHRTRRAGRRNYSGNHRSHGLHFLALTDEKGRLIWISAARPGHTHDNTAARHDHILAHLRAVDLGALADLGFHGLDNDILDPVIVTGCTASRTRRGKAQASAAAAAKTVAPVRSARRPVMVTAAWRCAVSWRSSRCRPAGRPRRRRRWSGR
ncbi:transposase family protein [Streptomyces sp. NPDC055749]